ncbi:MAG: amino acid ABC transporter permease [Anaerolineales bacterium]|nr:amino acid ABC transporter permease [Anaerolineales bacterium]
MTQPTSSAAQTNPPRLAGDGRSRLAPALDQIANWPWWLLVIIFLGLLILFEIVTNARMLTVFRAVSAGAVITLVVSISAYAMALVIGLLVGLGRVSKNRLAYNLAAFYVEVVRGVPILVLLLYIAFVGVPLFVSGVNVVGGWLGPLGGGLAAFSTRQVDFTLRVVLGLGMAYGAFEAEIFRAGIQSIERGQMEAARALGMSYFQAMRHIILPQAIRRILPVLGNDFVSMVKDSSLVSVLGVTDITQLAKLYASSTFLFFQTYSILAFIYLVLTILLTRGVRALEAWLTLFRQ